MAQHISFQIKINKILLSFIFILTTSLANLPSILGYDVLIGTGNSSDLNHRMGRMICRMINLQKGSINCKPHQTNGSLYNLDNVRLGSLEMGIVNSNVHYGAIHNTGRFKFRDTTYENIRSLFSLHTVPFTLITQKKSGIKNLDHLIGKRINIGRLGSSEHALMKIIFGAKEWDRSTFRLVEELSHSQSQDTIAFCHGRIQVMSYNTLHPNAGIQRLIKQCRGKLIHFTPSTINLLLANYPFLSEVELPGKLYSGQESTVTTIGLLSTVVTSDDLGEETAYSIVKTVFSKLSLLKRFHPAFKELTAEDMVFEGLSAPMHPGALRYYKEMGWR